MLQIVSKICTSCVSVALTVAWEIKAEWNWVIVQLMRLYNQVNYGSYRAVKKKKKDVYNKEFMVWKILFTALGF